MARTIEPQRESSFPLIAAQIIWFGIGLSLLADTAETILQWHRLLAVGLSSSLMIASTWLGMRWMVLLYTFAIPPMLSVLYFSLTQDVTGSGQLAIWSQMIKVKSVEYVSGLLIFMATFMKGASMMSKVQTTIKKRNWNMVMVWAGFVIGNCLMVLSDYNYAKAYGEPSLLAVLATNASSILGLCFLGLGVRASKKNGLSNTIVKSTMIPLKWIVLIAGTASALYFDWCYQYLIGWPQYIASCLLPMLLFLFVHLVTIKKGVGRAKKFFGSTQFMKFRCS